MEIQFLENNLKKFKLSTLLANLESFLRKARENKTDYNEFLFELTDVEVKTRADNRLKRLIREAKFPIIKPVETFDFDAVPELNINLLKDLTNCSYIKKEQNVIFLGKRGCGKTHMATSLELEACKSDYRTKFASCFSLTNELIGQKKKYFFKELPKDILVMIC